jgi:hypothetical protein
MNRLTATALLAALVTGCYSEPFSPYLSCRGDDECGDNQVCFPEGCGDPGKNIRVEVVPDPQGGLYAQDFRVEDLRSEQNIELFDPATVRGQVRVEGTSTGTYSSPVTLRLTGESLLIPGVSRRHETILDSNSSGYSLPVASGRYTVTLLAANTEMPPQSTTREVQPGHAVTLDFTLPASTSLLRLSGKVVGPDGLPVGVDLEAQALDEALRPLSQRVAVKRASGELSLSLPPSAAQLPNVLVQVLPTSAEALVPLKVFNVNPRLGIQEPLSMGDYGLPVPVRGQVKDQEGQPVAQATVYLQGKVGGGGQYSSRRVVTDADGMFELLTLASAVESPARLYVVPPPGSRAGITLKSLTVPRAGFSLAQEVTCGDRMKVQGTLRMPSGSLPAAGVKVVAEPIGELDGWPKPSFNVEASRPTDDMGRFELALDPGRYRLDFIPTDGLPRVSRIVTVRPGEDTPGGIQELSAFTLSKGRRVTGHVSFSGERVMSPAAPYARLRFFRVVDVEGKPSALLLSQTLTDQSGSYSTTLPTR